MSKNRTGFVLILAGVLATLAFGIVSCGKDEPTTSPVFTLKGSGSKN